MSKIEKIVSDHMSSFVRLHSYDKKTGYLKPLGPDEKVFTRRGLWELEKSITSSLEGFFSDVLFSKINKL